MDQKKRKDTIDLLTNQKLNTEKRLEDEYTDETYRKQLEEAIRKLDREIKELQLCLN